MTTRRVLLTALICLSAAAAAGSSTAQARRQAVRSTRQAQGAPGGFNPQEYERRMQAEAAERSRRWAAEAEQRRAQMMQGVRQSSRDLEQQRNEALKRAIGATDQQWAVIFPKLDRVRTLVKDARSGILTVTYSSGTSSGGNASASGPTPGANQGGGGTAGGTANAEGGATAGTTGGGNWNPLSSTEDKQTNTRTQSGWKWARPSDSKGRDRLTPTEKAAEDLLDSLEAGGSTKEAIAEKVAVLRKARETAARELPKAQQELRQVLTFQQEAALVVMGYLD